MPNTLSAAGAVTGPGNRANSAIVLADIRLNIAVSVRSIDTRLFPAEYPLQSAIDIVVSV